MVSIVSKERFMKISFCFVVFFILSFFPLSLFLSFIVRNKQKTVKVCRNNVGIMFNSGKTMKVIIIRPDSVEYKKLKWILSKKASIFILSLRSVVNEQFLVARGSNNCFIDCKRIKLPLLLVLVLDGVIRKLNTGGREIQ